MAKNDMTDSVNCGIVPSLRRTAVLTLHSATDSSGTIVRLCAVSAGIPLRVRMHPFSGPLPREVLAMNPAGTLPVLVTPQGPVSEAGAALLWLSDSFGLGPPTGDDSRPAFLRWLFFLSNTLAADLRPLIWPERFNAADEKAGQITLAAGRFLQALGHVEEGARLAPGLFAPPGALAFFSLMLARWATLYSAGPVPWFNLDAFPTLSELAGAAEALPAVMRVARSEGLGRHPFSMPASAAV